MSESADVRFGDLLDDLLTQLLDGQEPDLAATAARHPAVADRIAEALSLVSSTAGRRHHPRPSLQGYEVLREVGRGGMGSVYLARHESLGREVALKVLPHSLGLSQRSRQRFLTEARALAKVEHPHIVGIHRILDDDGVLAFEMEYVDGPSLHHVLQSLRTARQANGGPPTLAQIADALGLSIDALSARTPTQFFVRIAAKVARALGAVHEAGLVHRDVKPANVLLRRDGEPVLVDFGLARITGSDATRTGDFSGTPIYSSPEQLRGDPQVGPPADVYALGVTLYECLALAAPFAGRSTTDQLRHIESGYARPLRAAAPGVPRDLATIVAHAMESDPAQRYPDGTAMADDLQRLLDLQPILARPAGILRRAGKLLRRQRTPLLAACVGAVLVAIAMVPVLGHAEAAAAQRDLARGHVLKAQEHLLSIEPRRLGNPGPASDAPIHAWPKQATVTPLAEALAEYERALALDPGDATARRECAVVRIALWLRRLAVRDKDALARVLAGGEFAALAADVGPATGSAARDLATGTSARSDSPNDVTGTSPEDRTTAGLLHFLFGDFAACEESWRTLPAGTREQPLLDAALGVVHRADGLPEAAYPLLQQAQRHYPASARLRLSLADTAMALGDLQHAREWLAGVPDDPRTALVRRRLELDLAAATTPVDQLATAYRELSESDPSDPIPRLRLAQLALRQGDLRDAARRLDALIAAWPDMPRLRLHRARLALQQRNIQAYSTQVLAVLERDFGRRSSRGAATDLLEILRIGGLSGLYDEGLAGGDGRAGRATIGGEFPVRSFLPRIADDYETLARTMHAVGQRLRAFGDGRRVEGTIGFVLATLPALIARLPLLPRYEQMPLRAALDELPRLTCRVWPSLEYELRFLLAALGTVGWQVTTITPIERPADLPPDLHFGHCVIRADDLDGDGDEELLVGCAPQPGSFDPARVLLLDGARGAVLQELFGDSPDQIFGYALARTGDVDGDGRRDWLIGSPAGTQDSPGGTVEVWSSRTCSRHFLIEDDSASFGVAVTGLGDVDGDGTADFAIGSPPLLRNAAPQGVVHVHSGRTAARLYTIANDVPGVWFGTVVARASDADGDGVDELLVGGNYGDAPGLVRLYSGRTGVLLHTWSDSAPGSGFGTTVAGIGDADGDGRGDVAVSAVRTGETSGLDQVFLFSGADGRQLAVLTGERPGESFGRAMSLFRVSGQSPLLAVTAPGSDTIRFFTLDGVAVSTLVGSAGAGLGIAITTVDDRDGDGKEEIVATAARQDIGGLWRVDSSQIAWPR